MRRITAFTSDRARQANAQMDFIEQQFEKYRAQIKECMKSADNYSDVQELLKKINLFVNNIKLKPTPFYRRRVLSEQVDELIKSGQTWLKKNQTVMINKLAAEIVSKNDKTSSKCIRHAFPHDQVSNNKELEKISLAVAEKISDKCLVLSCKVKDNLLVSFSVPKDLASDKFDAKIWSKNAAQSFDGAKAGGVPTFCSLSCPYDKNELNVEKTLGNSVQFVESSL